MYNVSEDRFEVRGDRSVVGRAVVLHAGTDDLGLGGDEGNIFLFLPQNLSVLLDFNHLGKQLERLNIV